MGGDLFWQGGCSWPYAQFRSCEYKTQEDSAEIDNCAVYREEQADHDPLRAMFNGRFGNTSGRPYLEALVILPRLKIEAGVSFIVDTGADQTVLMPTDAIAAGVNYRKLIQENIVSGVGGSLKCFAERAILIVSDDKKLFAYVTDILIAEKKAGKQGFCPSLLGRDVLDRLPMKYNASKDELIFRPISADVVVPLDKQEVKPLIKRLRSKIQRLHLPE